MSELERLIEVVRRLRNPKTGCPWDSVQTNMSIRRYLVEETGEYLDALEEGDDYAVRDELGDILLQVVLNSQIAQDEGRFSIEDVARGEADKMIRRHPHVFGDSQAHSEDELRAQWENIKHTEHGYTERKSALDGVARHVPALMRAQKTLSKARRAGFHWTEEAQVLKKVEEEVSEVHEALAKGSEAQVAEELGDLLFAIVNLCAWRELNAEEVLQAAIGKFTRRFQKVETDLEKDGVSMRDVPLEKLVEAWKRAKQEGKCEKG